MINSPRTRLTVFVALALAGLLVRADAASAQKLLRWKLAPGEMLRVEFTQDMDMQTKLLDQPVQSSADMTMLMTWHVQRVTPGGEVETKQKIERVAMSMESPGSPPIKYDSADTGAREGIAKTLADSIQPLVGVEFLQQMNNRGEILDVQLSEAGQRRLATAPAAAQLNEMFSKDGLNSLLSQAATVLPEKPVRPGDQWTGITETKSPVGTLKMHNTYTYRGTEVRDGRPLERIDVAIQVAFDKEENALGLNVDVAEQENVGTMYFDAAAGRFVDSLLHQKMTLQTAIGQQTHEQKLDTKLRMRLTAMAPPATAQQPSQVGRRPGTSAAPRQR